MTNRLPKKVEFAYTVVELAYANGEQAWNAYPKAEYWHGNTGIYRGVFELSLSGTFFKSYEDAIRAAIRYEEAMDSFAFKYAK